MAAFINILIKTKDGYSNPKYVELNRWYGRCDFDGLLMVDTISRKHFRFYERCGKVFFEDDSTNGSSVMGIEVHHNSFPVICGDMLKLDDIPVFVIIR